MRPNLPIGHYDRPFQTLRGLSSACVSLSLCLSVSLSLCLSVFSLCEKPATTTWLLTTAFVRPACKSSKSAHTAHTRAALKNSPGDKAKTEAEAFAMGKIAGRTGGDTVID